MKDFLYFAESNPYSIYLKHIQKQRTTIYYLSNDGLNWHRVSKKSWLDASAHNKELHSRKVTLK